MPPTLSSPTPAQIEAIKREVARRRYVRFVQYTKSDYVVEPLHEYLAAKMQAFMGAVERKESPRLMVFVPPQHGKSELVSRRFPPFILGHHPDWRVILVSYGADLAEDMSQDARRILRDDTYAELFPKTKLDNESKAVSDWGVEGTRGGMRAIGVGGAITGRSAEVLIIDDPVKGRVEVDRDSYRDEQWAWWPQARDRVQRGGGIVLLCTRWHHDDLPGRLLHLASRVPDADQWEVVVLPAIAEEHDLLGREVGDALAPSRFDVDDLRVLKATLPPRDWLAKFQQKPTPDEGAIFKREWLRFEPVPQRNGFIIQAWDTAFSTKREADYSVCTVWRIEPTCYRLLDLYRARIDYPSLKDTIRLMARSPRYPANMVLIEAIGTGQSLVQDLRNETRLPIAPYRPDRDKVARAHAVTALFAGGRVVLPEGATWLTNYLDELLRFPVVDHDDQVDSTTMGLSVAGIWNAPVQRRGHVREFAFAPA